MIKIAKKTLVDLEFPVVLKQLKEHCKTDLGKHKSLKIKPLKTPAATLFALHQTKEFQSSFWEDEQIPGFYFESINAELEILKIENSVLEAGSFRKISALSETTNAHLLFFKKHRKLYPCLYRFSEPVEYTTALIDAINKIIDRFGEIKDEASPLLKDIRKSLIQLQQQIDSSFKSALSRYHASGYLDDIKESVMDGERVLAVSAMYKKRVKGRVLGRSNTGSIIFIQPESTLFHSREYRQLQLEEKEEIIRILKELTRFIRPYRELLEDYQDFLSEMDVIHAKVSYAESLRAVLPKITQKRELDLKAAYHPLLYLNNKKDNRTTFPQDIHLHPENRIVVISGPNAGGKSITLKTVGLLQVMLQSGLFVPVHEHSRMCLFTKVLSDIGDHQSIENHLSTYSYRLKNMRKFLKKCDANTLFLIDEFGTGSDPELGGALAETFLEVFYERESFGVITTHYANLKKMAQETPGISNANMRFDSRSLEPEYKLQMGEAGSSFTFEVAAKNGIPYSLINRSKKKVERGKIRFDKSIARLQEERSKLAKTTRALHQEKTKAEAHQEKLEDKNQRVQKKLEDFQELFDYHQQLVQLGRKIEPVFEAYFYDNNKKKLIATILEIVAVENSKRKKVQKKQRKREKEQQEKIRKEAERRIVAIRQEKEEKKRLEQQKIKKEKIKKIESFKPNDHVKLAGSSSVGTIDKIHKGRAVINYGTFTTEVNLEELEKVKGSNPK